MYFVHTDHLNTPRLIADDTGQTVWTWNNDDPYGNNAPNENPSGAGQFTCNLRLPGQYFDAELGAHYNYFRDYDPLTGRYVQSDPIGLEGGLNLYAYVGGNPIQYVDMLGLDVYLSGHIAGGVAGLYTQPTSFHFSIVLRPNNPSDFSNRTGWQNDQYGMLSTLGGQPSFLAFGNLLYKPNYEGDHPGRGSTWIEVPTPRGMTDTEFINRLIQAANCYKNDLPYSRPNKAGAMGPERYNSNSFVAGVIRAAGGTLPALNSGGLWQAPGYENPIPISCGCR